MKPTQLCFSFSCENHCASEDTCTAAPRRGGRRQKIVEVKECPLPMRDGEANKGERGVEIERLTKENRKLQKEVKEMAATTAKQIRRLIEADETIARLRHDVEVSQAAVRVFEETVKEMEYRHGGKEIL